MINELILSLRSTPGGKKLTLMAFVTDLSDQDVNEGSDGIEHM